jgi:NADH-quinone oxidoreductase subunit F
MAQSFSSLSDQAIENWDSLHNSPWIRVSTGLMGEAAGSDDILDALRSEIRELGIEISISEVGTTGLCYAEPLIDVHIPNMPRILYGNVRPDQIGNILRKHVIGGQPIKEIALASVGGSVDGLPKLEDLPMMQSQIRIALRNAGQIDPTNLMHYLAVGGFQGLDKALSSLSPEETLEEVKNSGLRGRGGAAFSTGTKWSFLAGNPSPVKYILCNCEEGDPGAFNDKTILETDPFTLIEGCILAGYATNASNGIVFIRHGHDSPIDRTRAAIEACYASGLLGTNILGSGFSFEMDVSLVGESYVAGEETALMEAVEGKRSMPRFRPPFPAAYGVWGKPSNINNIKTLSYVPEIIRHGADWFASIGTEKSNGTAIACLSGDIRYPGLVEVPFGTSVRQIIEDLGGGDPGGKSIKFLQTGGPLGGLLPSDQFDMKLDFDEMVAAGAMFGSGGLIVCNEERSVVDLTRTLVAFDQMESCGKCFPCRLGMSHMLEILERISEGNGRDGDMELMERVGVNMRAGSLCGHGQLGYNPVASAVRFFGSEFTDQLEEKNRSSIPSFVGPLATRRGSQINGYTPTSIVKADFVSKLQPNSSEPSNKVLE